MPLFYALFLLLSGSVSFAAESTRDYLVQPVPFTAVHVNDTFWAPRIEINRRVTIPFAFQKCEETGRVENFILAAKALRGEGFSDKIPPYSFDDTDIYKVIEGASYTLSVQPDAKLEAYIDGLIEKVASAQEKDGYLYTARTINPLKPHKWAGPERWVLEQDLSHELYNLGHLYEAAVAHFQATGKRNLLNIAIKTADLLVETFGPGKRSIWPGHQITEMGLVKLYRATGDERYLKLAKFLLDSRSGGKAYNQAHMKVIEQTEAVGHAVRVTGDASYVRALDRIWENVAAKKLYITGGIGALARGEAFGGDYDLPNMTAYNETCASIGNDYWNHRMFLLHADAKYIDVMERTLYNGLISGVSLDGKGFFYPNPLESNGQHKRSPWFGVACCPGNITRFIASVPGYAYAQKKDALYINLFMSNNAEIKMDGGRNVKLAQKTNYPWDGNVRIAIDPESRGRFAVHVRIPGWARGEVAASDLYRLGEMTSPPVVVMVNGKSVPIQLEKGYAAIAREWKKGDTIELRLPMEVMRVTANNQVASDRGRVALQRGPIVYAAEWADNPNGRVRNLVLPDSEKLTAEFRPALLNGVTILKSNALALAYDSQGTVVKTRQPFVAIPYYAWANRGPGQMMVWIPTSEASARPHAAPTIATLGKVTTSGKKNPNSINDGEEPLSSSDSSSYFDWWPTKGTTEWVELAFSKTAAVSQSEIYWFDDTGRGEVRVPAAWRLLYKDSGKWKPVENTAPYSSERDRYNPVSFKPVTTDGLRLEVTMQTKWSAGLQKWKVK